MSKRKNNRNRGGNTAAKNSKIATDVKAKIVAAVLVVLALVYVITSLAMGYARGASSPLWNPLKWGKVKGSDINIADETQDTNPVLAVTSDGEAIRAGGVYDLRRSSDAGITYLSNNKTYIPDGEIIVTAELENEYINGAYDWSIAFADPAAEWAVGKVANYFVSIEPIAGDSSSATLRYFAPFAEQIVVTATLRGTDSSDSFTVDCLKPVTLSDWWYYGDTSDCPEVSADVVYGTGTVVGDFISASFSIDITDQFRYAFDDYLKFSAGVLTPIKFGNAEVRTHTFNNKEFSVYADFGEMLTYSMIIRGFNDFDIEHKEAICFAWYNAAKASSWQSNFYLTATFAYGYGGIIASISECDYITTSCITGEICPDMNDLEVSALAPSVTLNKNYVF